MSLAACALVVRAHCDHNRKKSSNALRHRVRRHMLTTDVQLCSNDGTEEVSKVLPCHRRTFALLGVDVAAKRAVCKLLLGDSHPGPALAQDGDDSLRERHDVAQSHRLWCSCSCRGDSHYTLVDAPGHVDFLAFVDIALRVCSGALLVIPVIAPPGQGNLARSSTRDRSIAPRRRPVHAELATHWVHRTEHTQKPMGIVFTAESLDLREEPHEASVRHGFEEFQAAEAAFQKALKDLERLGLHPAVLSKPGFDEAAGVLTSLPASSVDEAGSDLLASQCQKRDIVPVVFLLHGASEKSRAGGDALAFLAGRLLPAVGDVVDGKEAGSWEGVDVPTGEKVMVCPRGEGSPFAGVAFQTTYLQGGSLKAFDLLVVRGSLRPGQQIINTTMGNGQIVFTPPRLELGGGCCGADVEEALPGDVVRITLPVALPEAAPGTGGLCSWCDPSALVRLPVLHQQAYADLAGDHCTREVCLDAAGQDRGHNDAVLAALAKSVEEDQSLRLEFSDDAHVSLTACGAAHMRSLRRRLQSIWGVSLSLRQRPIQYRATLRTPRRVQAEASAGGRKLAVSARAFPLPRGTGVRVSARSDILRRIGGAAGLEAFARGAKRSCRRGIPLPPGAGRCDVLQLADMEIRLCHIGAPGGEAAPACLSRSLLRAAGDRCAQGATEVGKAGASPLLLLEPLVDLSVSLPLARAKRVLKDLKSRGATVRKLQTLRPMLVSIKAEVPLRRLHCYDQALAKLSASTARFTMEEHGYTEVPLAEERRASGRPLRALLEAYHTAAPGA